MNNIINDVSKRHTAFVLVDVKNGNPNGNPMDDNNPRINRYNNKGEITKGCIGYKVKKYLEEVYGEKMYITENNEHSKLNDVHSEVSGMIKKGYNDNEVIDEIIKNEKDIKVAGAKIICYKYYDVRNFGAVLGTGKKKEEQYNSILGPIQISMAVSMDKILIEHHNITRCIKTESDNETTFGDVYNVVYGLYGFSVEFNPFAAKRSYYVTEKDLEKFWEALWNCWELDRSATRGIMTCRNLFILTHTNAKIIKSQQLLENIFSVKRINEGEYPFSYSDYQININKDKIPQGVILTDYSEVY